MLNIKQLETIHTLVSKEITKYEGQLGTNERIVEYVKHLQILKMDIEMQMGVIRE